MKVVLLGVGGILAHVLSLVIAQYSQWLLAKVVRGTEASFLLLEDLHHFFNWLLRSFAGRFADRRAWSAEEDEEGYLRPGLYRS